MFLFVYGEHQFYLWGHWYLYFGLLVTSKTEWMIPLHAHNGSFKLTTGAAPADLLVVVTWQASYLPTYFFEQQ